MIWVYGFTVEIASGPLESAHCSSPCRVPSENLKFIKTAALTNLAGNYYMGLIT